MVEFDDGSGPSLFVGGAFTVAGGVPVGRIAKWDGSTWTSLSTSTDGFVRALEVFDDGSGPALYAAGDFTMIDGVAANRIARWDGIEWTGLGTGLNALVSDLIVFDDISGPGQALYAAGSFTAASGVPVSRVARWNGASWAPVGTGINNIVNALAVFDDGGGSELYVGGKFTAAGTGSASRIARFDGTNWQALGTGVTGGSVDAMAVFEAGGVPKLFVGGEFTNAGGISAIRIATWNGSLWAAAGTTFNNTVRTLTAVDSDGPGGAALYVGGSFTGSAGKNQIYRWNGSSWQALQTGVNAAVWSIAAYAPQAGGSTQVFAGGDFTTASGISAERMARWNGSSWQPMAGGLDDSVLALTTHFEAGVPALYAAGKFVFGKAVPVNRIARWVSNAWIPLGTGMNNTVNAMASLGSALYAGGLFTTAGSVAASRIARWQGGAWSTLGSGMDGPVFALSVFDDGAPGGARLVAGGLFLDAGGVAANGIAQWDGFSWSPLGDAGNVGAVFAMTTFDDQFGGGEALYAGGNFTMLSGTPFDRIARWDGTAWSSLGTGMNGAVTALTACDDGPDGGPALYAGGVFTQAGGITVNHVARWDGSAWWPLSVGAEIGLGGSVDALVVYDDGTGDGPVLFAAGSFTTAGGVPAANIARWDGVSRSPLASGLTDRVRALFTYDDDFGDGTALFAGGDFATAPDSGDGYIARWGGCAPAGPGWSNQGSALAGVTGIPLLSGQGSLEGGTSNAVNLSNAAPSALTGTLLALSSLPVPFKGGTLLPFPFLVLITLPTTPAGALALPFGMPSGVPAGTEIWVQCAIQDAAAIKGVALSNALRGITP